MEANRGTGAITPMTRQPLKGGGAGASKSNMLRFGALDLADDIRDEIFRNRVRIVPFLSYWDPDNEIN